MKNSNKLLQVKISNILHILEVMKQVGSFLTIDYHVFYIWNRSCELTFFDARFEIYL